ALPISIRQSHTYYLRHLLDGGTFLYAETIYLSYRSQRQGCASLWRTARTVYGNGTSALVGDHDACNVHHGRFSAYYALSQSCATYIRLDASQVSICCGAYRLSLGELMSYDSLARGAIHIDFCSSSYMELSVHDTFIRFRIYRYPSLRTLLAL